MLKIRPLFTSSLLTLLSAATHVPAQSIQPADASLLAERRPAAFAVAIQQALQNDDSGQAYLHARAWKRAAPNEIAPLTALAGAYLAFDAPAAALDTLDAALVLTPDAAETRRILALKIQTHAEMGDHPAAWANARAYLRTAAPDDAFAPVLSELQWSSFGPIVAAAPYAAVMERVAASPDPVPLTASRIQADSAAITAALDHACNLAYESNNEDAIARATSELMRYLLVAHYVQTPAQPNTSLAPLYDSPNLVHILRDLAAGDNPSGLALSLLEWTPQRSELHMDIAGDTGDDSDPDDNGDALRREIEKFLTSAPAAWRDLQQSLTQALRTADSARAPSEIEAALRDLITLQNTSLAQLTSQAINYSDGLRLWQEARTTPPLATDTQFIEQLNAWAKTLETAPAIAELQRRLSPALPDDSPDASAIAVSLPHRLAQIFLREADAAWTAPLLAFEKIPAPRLEDFDVLIARDLMTPALWARRVTVAQQLNDWTEIAWSGVEARANDPAAIAAWLAPLITENDAAIARALQTLASGTDEQNARALADLETSLRRDPGHLAGLQTLYQSYLDRGDDSTASLILESLWRLSPTDFSVDDDTLALAARAGRWPLLLSLADYRLARSDTDLSAHLHRQVAAVALGLGGLAADSTPALDGTVYTNHARVLHSMAYELKTQNLKSFSDPLTGLKSTYELLGIENDDPVVRLWFALGLKLSNRTFGISGVKEETLATNVSPAMKAHLAFIRDDKPDAPAYLASFQGSADEGTALFLHHFIAAQLQPPTANQDALAALAERTDLPLFFRAKAAGAGNPTLYAPNIPLRASDPYYTAAGTKNWDAVWSTLSPGQQLIALGEVQLPKDTATLPILRLSRPARNPLVALSNTQTYRSRLWELDGVRVSAKNSASTSWILEYGSVVAATRSSIQSRLFSGEGSLWLENSDLVFCNGQFAQLFQSDVKANKTNLRVTRRWEADLLRAEDTTVHLGATTAADDAPAVRAFVNDALFVNHESELFTLRPSATLRISDTRFYTQKPLGLSAGQVVFKNTRVTGVIQPALASAEGVQLTPLNLTGPADRTVSTAADLRQALGAAKPGQRIDVAPGRILLDDGPIQVPHGVVLRGSAEPKNPTILSVSPASPTSPLVIANRGDSWIEHLALDVEKAITKFGDREIGLADRLDNRRALVAQGDSRPLLRNLDFRGWSSRDRERQAIVAEGAQVSINSAVPTAITLSSDGRVDHVGSLNSSGLTITGTGDAYFSYAGLNEQVISGKGVRFHGSPAAPSQLVYRNGAGDPRTLAWRAIARQNLLDTLARMKTELPAQLNTAADTDARIALFDSAAARLGPLVRASQMTTGEIASAFSSGLNPALTSRPDEFPFYMEAFHLRSRAFTSSVFLYSAHAQTFAPAFRDRLKAHLNALVGSRQRTGGELTSADRSNLMTLMRQYPVGSPHHARALAAFTRGETATAFQSQLAQEAAVQRRIAENAAQLRRQQQLEWERQQRIAQTPPAPAKKSWWEDYQSQYPNGRYNSRGSTGGSADQQMRNYRHELNKRIYNTGRDYGQRRIY